MMQRRLSELVRPFLWVLVYPVLLKVLPSARTLTVLWIAAMVSIAAQAGIDISKKITYRQAVGLLIVGGVALVGCLLAGWISFQDAQLEYLLGDIALLMMLFVLPLQAFAMKLNEKRKKGHNQE